MMLYSDPQSTEIQKGAEFIRRGELVVFPTETVYGLGASLFLPEAVDKIFHVKQRPYTKPLTVHISRLEQLDGIVKEVPKEFDRLAQAFFPGPLTIILPKKACVPSIVSANGPTIGVRMPSHPIAKQLIDAVGAPIVATSVNLSGQSICTTQEQIFQAFGEKISLFIEGNPSPNGVASTVLSLTPQLTILRQGAISLEQIEEILLRSCF